MSFLNILKESENVSESVSKIKTKVERPLHEEKKKPEEILRGNGFKIKLVTPTAFGTQIDFAKTYVDEEIKEILKDFTIKIKEKSVFIVD